MHGEETSARGSSESPCRAFHPLNFPPRAQSKNRRSNSRPPVRMPPNEPAKAVPKGDALQHMYSCFFFARCCLGKVPGGAPFSQLHKSDKQSRVDKPKLASNKQIKASRQQIPKKEGDGKMKRMLEPSIKLIGEVHRMSE